MGMMGTNEYWLQMILDITGEPEFRIAEKKYYKLVDVIDAISETVCTFGDPDVEPRVLTFILRSSRK